MKYLAIAVFLISVLIISAIGSNQNPADQAKNKDRDAIKICWQEYERKSLSPADKQLTARVCEVLEDGFLKKYNTKPCFGSSCAPS